MADLFHATCLSCRHQFEYLVGALMSGPRLTCQRCGQDPDEGDVRAHCRYGGTLIHDDGEIAVGHRCPKCDSVRNAAEWNGCAD